jgi:hypothetical protein
MQSDINSANGADGRPRTPDPTSDSTSEHTTPSKSPDTNGKRRMQRSKDGPITRQGEHLKDARGALERWRFKTQRDHYSPSSVTAVTLLLDPTLTTLASNARIHTIEDIESCLNPPWIMARRHGNEVLILLKAIDDAEKLAREGERRSKADKRRKVTEARQAERRAEQDREREEQQVQKAIDQAERDRKKEEERAAKRRQRDAERVTKQQQREAAKPRPLALAGSSVFNVTPLTPAMMAQVRFNRAYYGNKQLIYFQSSLLNPQLALPRLNLLPSAITSQPPSNLHWTPPSTPYSMYPSPPISYMHHPMPSSTLVRTSASAFPSSFDMPMPSAIRPRPRPCYHGALPASSSVMVRHFHLHYHSHYHHLTNHPIVLQLSARMSEDPSTSAVSFPAVASDTPSLRSPLHDPF